MRKFLVALLVLLGVAALVAAFLPMRLVTGGAIPELEAESVSGTIWNGQLRGVRYQRVPVGDVDAGLSLGSVLRLQPEVRFRRPDRSLGGFAGITRGERRLADVTGALDVPLGRSGLSLALGFEELALVTDTGGRCLRVSGMVTASLGNVPVLGSTPAMRGAPGCEGEGIRLPLLLEQGGMGLDIRIGRRLDWTAELSVLPANRLVGAGMLLGGFATAPPGTVPLAGEGALVLGLSGAVARPRSAAGA
jgi:hypothetical protein